MAVPCGMTLRTLKGSFIPNKNLSGSQDEVLALQGVPYPVRQVLKIAKVQIDILVTQVDDDGAANVTPTGTKHQISMASNLSGIGFLSAAPLRVVGIPTNKTEVCDLDGSEYTQTEPVVGTFRGRMWFSTAKDLGLENLDGFLKIDQAEAESEDEIVLRWSIQSLSGGHEPWYSEQVWCISDGRYTGRVKMSRGPESAYARLVYDYVQ